MPGATDTRFIGESFVVESLVVQPDAHPLVGWTVREYHGFEIYAMPDLSLGLTERQLYVEAEWPRDAAGHPLYHRVIVGRDDLHVGDRVIWKGNGHDDIHDPGVIVGDGERLHVESTDGSMLGLLAHAQDDRACWVCVGLCDTRGMARVSFS